MTTMKPLLAIPFFLALLSACTQEPPATEPAEDATAEVAEPAPAEAAAEDPYLWLENVEGEDALAWVEEQNGVSLGYLEALPTFEPLYQRNLEIYNSDQRIPMPAIRGSHVYNFWRDDANIRGLWRRMPVEAYLAGGADWEVLLDLDTLAAAEEEDWVWKGSTCLRPEYRHCLVNLSRGGADATVVREFDTEERAFVEGGFALPEAKSQLSWRDADALWVGTDFGPGSLTDSGYPRTSRSWQRGTPLDKAPEVFSGEQTDVSAGVFRTWDGDTPYDLAYRSPDFFTRQVWFITEEGYMNRIAVPEDANFQGIFQGQMLVGLRTAWKPAEVEYPQGALLAIDFAEFMAGDRAFDVLFRPSEGVALQRAGVATTRDYVLLNLMDNVVGRMQRLSREGGAWRVEEVPVESNGTIGLVSTAEESNLLFYQFESFLRPDTLFASTEGGLDARAVASLPEFFNADGMSVEQHFAVSKDGTKVPYFLVLPQGFEANGTAPTLIYGYGGFQISRTPGYSATVGHAWLARGGAYVVANIRGGGEYGPAWHQAALKENRQRAYDDFIAVAEDLVQRKITSPGRLGIRGGSNGGLLTGVMLTQRPELWNAVVVQVPLLDMQRFNKLLAGASWMAEYGNPDTGDWAYIREYSPYHNVKPDVKYPKAFFTTSTRDDRVHPAHARKMVAKMRAMGHDLLYFENTVGGHAGASDNTQAARNEALIYSYLWDQLKE